MKTFVTVFLPGLLPKILLDKEIMLSNRPLKALCTLLSRATRIAGPQTPEKAIKTFFQGLGTSALPSGALGALAQGFIAKDDSGTWCQVSPIACQIDQKAAYMLGNHQLSILQAESEQLLFQLNEFLQQDGLFFQHANTTDWYCMVPNHKEVVMNDLLEVLNKNIGFLLPSGPDEVYWRRLLTECQMILGQHPVNQERQRLGQVPISSVWFWGLGSLPRDITTSFSQVITQSKLLTGLAMLAASPAIETPNILTHEIFKNQQSLLADHLLIYYHQYRDYDKWFELLQSYEERWFIPLLNMLTQGTIDSVKIVLGDNREFIISKRQLKYFWRTIKPLESFVLN